MMKILNIEPKDIHVTLDMGIQEIKLVLDALENSEIKFDSEEQPDLPKAADFLKVFFKTLDDVVNEVEGK
jgi:hypothetical protein